MIVDVDPGDLRAALDLAGEALTERLRLAGVGLLVDHNGRRLNLAPAVAALQRLTRALDVPSRTPCLVDEWESVHDSAMRIGIGDRHTRRLVHAGRLTGEPIAGIILIRKDSWPCP